MVELSGSLLLNEGRAPRYDFLSRLGVSTISGFHLICLDLVVALVELFSTLLLSDSVLSSCLLLSLPDSTSFLLSLFSSLFILWLADAVSDIE